jgi:hypothetical protein
MGKMKAPPGQRCECPLHPLMYPHLDLSRVFYCRPRDSKYCYEWWCAFCVEEEEVGEIEEGWPPRGDNGRFYTPPHCQIVPGLD